MSQSDSVTETRTPTGILDRIRANPTGRLALKIGVGVLGGLVVALGIVLIPFPGPGWAIVILGLAIWAVEFVWARHLLQFTKRHVQGWTHWVLKQSLPVRALIGLVGFVFICAVVWLSVKLTMHIDLAVVIRDFLAGR
ncbi:TIGR02611 family protein [Actinoplanes sp. NPDC051475]|uniref:TIGR02611 family protein n=1 Tax=Actinoplanes sp. NPDC051475 TaxID=3157225 RepID=UPI00344BA37F